MKREQMFLKHPVQYDLTFSFWLICIITKPLKTVSVIHLETDRQSGLIGKNARSKSWEEKNKPVSRNEKSYVMPILKAETM